MSFTSLFWASWQFLLSSYLLIILLLGLSAVIVNGVYNRYFHPLSKFPGPFWASVTDLYLVYMISSVPTYGLELHKKHGRIVRLAPNLLSFSDPELLPVVYHRRADKTPFYGSWLFDKVSAMFQTLPHEDHAVKKRAVSPCCSMKLLREFEGQIDNRILEFCGIIRQRSAYSGAKLDFSEYIRWFLNDTFSDVVHGEPIGCVAQGHDVHGLIRSLQGIYTMSGTVAVLPWLMLPLVRNPFLRRHVFAHSKAFKSINSLCSHYDNMVAKRAETPRLKDMRCLFDGISLPNQHVEHPMNKEYIKAEAMIFTSAALEGVAAFISPFIDNILQHPAVYAKLRAEIDSADAAGALSSPIVTYDETNALPYCIACIYETLRHDAPAQTILPRYVSQPGIHVYGSCWIPGGTEMAASPYIIHRDTGVFGNDADKFRPERWLEDPAQNERMERYGMWFGYGDRECPGKNFAHLEFQKLCVQLIREFDIASATPEKRFTHKRWAVAMFWNHWLQFKERDRKAPPQ